MTKRNVRKEAFTLIELLVVIAVIAMLTSIVLPALRKAKESARKIVCLSNCRQWATATQTYAVENDDYFPQRFWRWDDGTLTSSHNAPYYYYSYEKFDLLDVFVEPYLGESDYADCPSNPNQVLSWDEQKEPTGINYVSGDYVIYVGYPKNLGIAVAWGPGPDFVLNTVPARNQAYVPPAKTCKASSRLSVVGCPVIQNHKNEKWKYYHPYTTDWVDQEPKAANSAFADGSASSVPKENLVIYQKYLNHSLKIQYLWPNPK